MNEDATMKQIGEILRKRRIELGKTQQRVAQRAGIGQGNLARIESGTHSIRIDILSRICDVLGLRIELVEVPVPKIGGFIGGNGNRYTITDKASGEYVINESDVDFGPKYERKDSIV
jgi:transcriptional regulator with XRE-family HTH domain